MLYSSLEEVTRKFLFQCLQTVLETPRLASQIKMYTGWHKPWTWIKASATLHFSIRADFKTLIQSGIESCASDEQEAHDWYEAIVDGSWDAATALLLAYLPSLQHLHLKICGVHESYPGPYYYRVQDKQEDYYWIHEIVMQAAQLQLQRIISPQALEHLTSLTIVPNKATNRELSMSKLMPFLKLRSVKTIVLNGWDLTSWDTDLDVELNVVEMELLNFNIMLGFTSLFRTCFPRLEILSYNHLDVTKYSSQPQPNAFIRTLKQVHPPLRELRMTDWSIAEPFSAPDPAHIESLSTFPGLEIIEIMSFERWVNWLPESESVHFSMAERLPDSVKELTL